MNAYAKWSLLGMFCATMALGAAEKKPAWVENRLGMEGLSPDYVEPGYGLKPLKLFGRTVVMDFKNITLGADALPSSIAVHDEKILTAPVCFDVVGKNGAIHFQTVSSPVKMMGKNTVVGSSLLLGDDLELKIEFKVEFDFAFVYTVTLTPKKPLELKKFSLEIPLKLPTDKLIALNYEPLNRPVSGLEKERRRPRFNLKDGTLFECEYAPDFWIGNTHYGLSINFATGANWKNQLGKEIVFNPKTSILAYNLIDREVKLEKPEVYHFYLITTPLRRMSKNWRDWRVRTRYGNFTPTDGNEMIYWQMWRASRTEIHNNLWVADAENLKRIALADKTAGRDRLHYKAPGLVTHTALYQKGGKSFVLEDPYLRKICEQNEAKPGYRTRPVKIPADAQRFTDVESLAKAMGVSRTELHTIPCEDITVAVNQVPEFTDYEIFAVNNLLDMGTNGVYFDGISSPVRFNVKDDRGNLRSNSDIEAGRNFFKRARALMRSNDVNAHMLAHNTGNRYAPGLSFFDMVLFGENYFYWYQEPEKRDASKNGDYYYAHIFGDIDNLKVDFSRQWGQPQILLPELRGRDYKVFANPTKGTRTMLAYMIQFDMLFWTSWCDNREIYKFDMIRKNWNMRDTAFDTVEFVPYWENKLFTSPDPNVKTGYYERIVQLDPDQPLNRDRKYLVLVSNIQFGEAASTLTLPKLTDLKVIERQTGRTVTVKNGGIEFSLAPYDFAVFEVTGKAGQ